MSCEVSIGMYVDFQVKDLKLLVASAWSGYHLLSFFLLFTLLGIFRGYKRFFRRAMLESSDFVKEILWKYVVQLGLWFLLFKAPDCTIFTSLNQTWVNNLGNYLKMLKMRMSHLMYQGKNFMPTELFWQHVPLYLNPCFLSPLGSGIMTKKLELKAQGQRCLRWDFILPMIMELFFLFILILEDWVFALSL